MNFARIRDEGDALVRKRINYDIASLTRRKPCDWEETVQMLRNLPWRFIGARPEGEFVVAVYRHRQSGYYAGVVEIQSEFWLPASLVQ